MGFIVIVEKNGRKCFSENVKKTDVNSTNVPFSDSLFAAVDAEPDDEAEEDGDDDGEHHDDDEGEVHVVPLPLDHSAALDFTLWLGPYLYDIHSGWGGGPQKTDESN